MLPPVFGLPNGAAEIRFREAVDLKSMLSTKPYNPAEPLWVSRNPGGFLVRRSIFESPSNRCLPETEPRRQAADQPGPPLDRR